MVTPIAIDLRFWPDLGARRPAVLVGQTIRMHAGFRTEAGALVQPTGLVVTVKRPDNVVITWPAGQVILDADGRYSVDLTADVPGIWGVQWRCAGPAEAVRERQFVAQPQQVAPGDPGPVLVMDDLGPVVAPSGGPFTARRVTYLPVFEHADGLILIAVENGELKAVPFGSFRLRTEATYTFFAELAPTLNQVIAAFPVASSGRIPAGLAGSSMLAETAITGVAAVQLWNNATWTTIGTFTFSAGVQPILSGAPVADLPVIEGTHRLRVIATNPWTKAGLEVRLKQL
jgi:hypothetical protein